MGLFSGIGKALKGVTKAVIPAAAGYLTGGWGAALGAVGNYLGQQDQQSFASAQSAEQMQFQERMSNTAHQRERADLIAAGMNPMLSVTKGGIGASTPSGSMAPTLESSASSASRGASDALSRQLVESQIKSQEAQASLSNAQAGKANLEAQGQGIENSMRLSTLSNEQLSRERSYDARTAQSIYEQYKANNDYNSVGYLNDLAVKKGFRNYEEAIADTNFRSLVQDVMQTSLKTNELAAYSDMYATDYGKHVVPYLNSATSLSNMAAGGVGAFLGGKAGRSLPPLRSNGTGIRIEPYISNRR